MIKDRWQRLYYYSKHGHRVGQLGSAHYRQNHWDEIQKRMTTWNKITGYDLDRLKNRPCMDCGGWFEPCQMDWDHVRGIKLCSISALRSQRARKRLVEEIAKCDLVCANC